MVKLFLAVSLLLLNPVSKAQSISYPFPTKYITVNVEGANVKMAYMDAQPEKPNGLYPN